MSFTNVDTGFSAERYSFDGPDFSPLGVEELVVDFAELGVKTDTMGAGDGDVPDSVGGEVGNVPDSIGGEDDEDEREDDDAESERR